ncbi:phosphatidylinositol-4-phosphate 5-kinase [Aquipluma nitroreducens]|uniref:Phosphatidylinositol-4-phosphate 5-kinase n=1 Tax=Aquipluma nitroreducens TaxID=2010828 RepID=A0A5K7S4G2_9BACT|nr:hypothetical protein [Aquipluma nitroreducens]BBE16416.1 phosphatidylinositol-4-phosphate 5-kinase [Aquipluma nitroreducens]
MKPKHLLPTLLLTISVIHFSYSQPGNCKVLKPEIATSYSGECKKGLANGNGTAVGTDKYEGKFKDGLPQGNGTYHYANGDVYIGDFKEGMRSGNGKFTFKFLGKDSTYMGMWKEDKLVKKIVPAAYLVSQKQNLQRYTVQKIKTGNRVVFSFMQNGGNNRSLTGLLFTESSGTLINLGQDQGFDNVQFPFNCKVSYSTLNSFRSSNTDVIFDIQINEPGQWVITLFN